MTLATPAIKVKVYVDSIRIEQVEALPVPKGEVADIPITNHDSGGATENLPGRYNAGKTELQGVYASGQTGITYLETCSNDKKLHNFEIDWEDGSYTTFQAYIGVFQKEEDKERMVYRIAVKPQGIPKTSATRTALTTPYLSFKDQADGALTGLVPAASATVGKRVLPVVTGTTGIKITATCATSGATIYLGTYDSDGILTETLLTTATASSLISLNGATSITEMYVRVSESGKADAFYPITVARA